MEGRVLRVYPARRSLAIPPSTIVSDQNNMDTISLVLAFIFGAIVGSFLNVVSLRFNTGHNIGGRSHCMSCGKQLTWKELVPIFSFLIQGGTCRHCKSKVSWQYPLVELCSAIIFVMIMLVYPPVTMTMAFTTLVYVIITGLLLVISAYDIKHKIIPDSFVYTFAVIAFINLFVGGASWFHIPTVWALVAGPLLALPFALIWVFSKGTWMGLGDAKLILGIGWLLGISRGVNAIIIAFWIAAIISVIWLFATYKRFKPRTEIPFGPYLIVGMYIVLLFGLQVLDIGTLKLLLMSYI